MTHWPFLHACIQGCCGKQSHGELKNSEHGSYRVAFDVHTQIDAIKEKYVLNPLEKYENIVTNLKADGKQLVDKDLSDHVVRGKHYVSYSFPA